MKKFDEIFQEVWNSIGGPKDSPYQFEQGTWNRKLVKEVARQYAREAIEEQLKVAASEALTRTEVSWGFGGSDEYQVVDQDSVLNCTRVELL